MADPNAARVSNWVTKQQFSGTPAPAGKQGGKRSKAPPPHILDDRDQQGDYATVLDGPQRPQQQPYRPQQPPQHYPQPNPQLHPYPQQKPQPYRPEQQNPQHFGGGARPPVNWQQPPQAPLQGRPRNPQQRPPSRAPQQPFPEPQWTPDRGYVPGGGGKAPRRKARKCTCTKRQLYIWAGLLGMLCVTALAFFVPMLFLQHQSCAAAGFPHWLCKAYEWTNLIHVEEHPQNNYSQQTTAGTN